MTHCKKTIIATCFFLTLPIVSWSEAPVIDDSDNFAMVEEQQAFEAPVDDSKYGDSQAREEKPYHARSNEYAMNDVQEDGPALAKDDNAATTTEINDNANLIEKVQSLQKEIQELRGQLEVQAHDLKMLQQQQLAFYKDLDARLGTNTASSKLAKPATELSLGAKVEAPKVTKEAVQPSDRLAKSSKYMTPAKPVSQVSRVNPADEQISYLAAYELVKNKHFDDAIIAMESFVQKYPQGGYTANAEYWLGELYMVKKEYSKALKHFDLVLNEFPTSSKSAASMLKSGYVYNALGNQQEAIKRLQQVISTYPDTATAQMAKAKLEAITQA